MKIKYVGLKDEETAFSHKTGIVWTPGSSHEISDQAMAKQMLQHPDVFAEDDGTVADGTVKGGAPARTSITVADGTVKGGAPARTSITVADGTVKNLEGLDKEALHALAKELGVQVHHAAGAAKVAEAMFAAFPE